MPSPIAAKAAAASAAAPAPPPPAPQRWRIAPDAQRIDLAFSDEQLRGCRVAELATALSLSHGGRWPARLFLLPPPDALLPPGGGAADPTQQQQQQGVTLLEDATALLAAAGFTRASRVVCEWHAAPPPADAALVAVRTPPPL
jgi:hypothetical protein